MRTLNVRLSIGYPSAVRRGEVQVDDDATDEEIEEAVKDWAANYIEIGWDEE